MKVILAHIKNAKLIYLIFLVSLLALIFGFSNAKQVVFADISNGYGVIQNGVDISGDDIDSKAFYYIEWSNCSVTYNGEKQSPIAILRKNGDDSFSRDLVCNQCVDANEYTVTATSPDYEITSGNTASFVINPCEMDACSITLDTESFTYDGTPKKPSVSVTFGDSTLAPDVDYTIEYSNITNVNNEAQVSIIGKGNFRGTVHKYFSIIRGSFSSSVSISGWTFGQAANAPTVNNNPENGVISYLYSNSLNGVFDITIPSDAGTYYVKAIIAETNNYNQCETDPVQFVISAKSVAVAWNKAGSYTYNGNEQGPTATYENINGDNVSLTVSGTGTNAGDYTAEVAENAAGNNYILTNLTCVYKIEKYYTEIIWEASKFIANGTAQGPCAYVILIDGERIDLPIIGYGTEVGNYIVNIDTTALSENYALSGPLSFGYSIIEDVQPSNSVLGSLGIVFLVLFIILLVVTILFFIPLPFMEKIRLNLGFVSKAEVQKLTLANAELTQQLTTYREQYDACQTAYRSAVNSSDYELQLMDQKIGSLLIDTSKITTILEEVIKKKQITLPSVMSPRQKDGISLLKYQLQKLRSCVEVVASMGLGNASSYKEYEQRIAELLAQIETLKTTSSPSLDEHTIWWHKVGDDSYRLLGEIVKKLELAEQESEVMAKIRNSEIHEKILSFMVQVEREDPWRKN